MAGLPDMRVVVKDAAGSQVFSTRLSPDGSPEVNDRGVEHAAHARIASDGVLVARWPTHRSTAGGEYTLRVEVQGASQVFDSPRRDRGTSGQRQFSVSMPPAERRVVLQAARDRRMTVQVTFDRDAYGPGEEAAATVLATRASGAPAAGAAASGEARVGGAVVWSGDVLLDADGRGAMRIGLPASLGETAGEGADTLSVTVSDTDRSQGGTYEVESTSRAIPMATSRVEVLAYPEGGELVAGLPARLYFEATLPSGDPADVAVAVCPVAGSQVELAVDGASGTTEQPSESTGTGVIDALRQFLHLAGDQGGAGSPASRGGLHGAAATTEVPDGCLTAARTQHEGKGVTPVFIVPEEGAQLELRILEPASASRTIELRPVRPFGVSLFAPESTYSGDGAVKVLLASSHRGHVTVGLYRKERMLSQVGVALSGEAPISTAVSLVPQLGHAAVGVLRVTVVETETGVPLAERLVFRAPRRSNIISVEARSGEINADESVSSESKSPDIRADGKSDVAVISVPTERWNGMLQLSPPPHLEAQESARTPTFAPGSSIQLAIRARGSTGRPIPSLVLARVIDDQDSSRVERRRWQPRPLAQLLLEAEVDALSGRPFGAPLPDAGAYLSDIFPGLGVSEREASSGEKGDRGASAADATDLLLGTQGWRRFVYTDLPGALEPIMPRNRGFDTVSRPRIPPPRPGMAVGGEGAAGRDSEDEPVEPLRLGMPAPARDAAALRSRNVDKQHDQTSRFHETLASLHWQKLFTPSKDVEDAERVARAVCLALPTSDYSINHLMMRSTAGAGSGRNGFVMVRGGHLGAAGANVMDGAEGIAMMGAPMPMMAMMDHAEMEAAPQFAAANMAMSPPGANTPAMAKRAFVADEMGVEDAVDLAADQAPMAPGVAVADTAHAAGVQTQRQTPRRSYFFQRVFAHQTLQSAVKGGTRRDFAKTVAFGAVQTQSGDASIAIGLPDTVGRFRVEVDVLSHPSLGTQTTSPSQQAQRNRGSATTSGAHSTSFGAFTGYLRTAKPLSISVAPLPVIGSDDKYILPIVAAFDSPALQDGSLSMRVRMGPFAAPLDADSVQSLLPQSFPAATKSWTVLARPAKQPGLPMSVASDDPGAQFVLGNSVAIQAGISGDRQLLGLQGLLPRPPRPVPDIEQGQDQQGVRADRSQRSQSPVEEEPEIPGGAVRQTIHVAACQDCNPLSADGTSPGPAIPGRAQDAWEGSFLVEPAGYLREAHSSGMLSSAEPSAIEIELPVPEDVLPGSMRAAFALYQSPAATLGGALESLIRQPHGCFEQSSSTVYPMAMALHYFRMHPDTPGRVIRKAEKMLQEGYKKLITFECQEHPGGFDWFGCQGSAQPHEALTAYGALEFLDMSSVWHGVDAALLARVRRFLLDRRDGNGGFQRQSRSVDSFGRAPGHTTDSYILWSLLAPPASERSAGAQPLPEQQQLADSLQSELKRSIARLSEPVDTKKDAQYCAARGRRGSLLLGSTSSETYGDDPYYASLVALAAMDAGRFKGGSSEEGVKMAMRLLEAQEQGCASAGSVCMEGSVPGARASITCSGGAGLEVETTSLAVLAWLKARRSLSLLSSLEAKKDSSRLMAAAALGVRWVLSQNQGGRFGTTQATVLALKAITEFDAAMASSVAGATFFLFTADGKLLAEGKVPGVVDKGQAGGVEPLAPILLDEQPLLDTVQRALAAANQRGGSLVMRARLQKAQEGTGDTDADDAMMPWSLKLSYRSKMPPPRNAKNPANKQQGSTDEGKPRLDLRVELTDDQLQDGKSTELRVRVSNLRASKGLPMTIAVVGVPAGLQAKPSQLQGLVAMGKLDAWEQRGRELLLYWRGIGAGARKELEVQLDAVGMGVFKAPTSRAYLYYDEDVEAFADAVSVTILPSGR